MAGRLLTIEETLKLLAETPARIAMAIDGLTAAQLRAAPSDGEWSANDVLAHLRSCADVWGKCIAAMLAEDRPTLRAIDPRTWTKQTKYPDLEFALSFRAFATQRDELLTILTALLPEQWARAATVTGAGAVLERSVHFYAQWLARHEQPHIKQIRRIANSIVM